MNLATPDRAKERQADQYAAHLLLPGQLFKPLIKQIKTPSLKDVDDLAKEFECSLLCAALRLIDVDTVPAILVCHDSKGLRWSLPTKDVPRRWYLKDQLDEDSFAYDLLNSGKAQAGLRKSSANTWFTNDDGGDYELQEHSMQGFGGEILTLIIPGKDMLDAQFDPGAFPTKYNEKGAYTVRRPRSK